MARCRARARSAERPSRRSRTTGRSIRFRRCGCCATVRGNRASSAGRVGPAGLPVRSARREALSDFCWLGCEAIRLRTRGEAYRVAGTATGGLGSRSFVLFTLSHLERDAAGCLVPAWRLCLGAGALLSLCCSPCAIVWLARFRGRLPCRHDSCGAARCRRSFAGEPGCIPPAALRCYFLFTLKSCPALAVRCRTAEPPVAVGLSLARRRGRLLLLCYLTTYALLCLLLACFLLASFLLVCLLSFLAYLSSFVLPGFVACHRRALRAGLCLVV